MASIDGAEPKASLDQRPDGKIFERENLKRAYKRVKANKGAPEVDGMSVREMYEWLREHKEELIAALLEGNYEPQPVRGVVIEKPGGGTRQLGIPTVADRRVQQATLQVLEEIVDTILRSSSTG